MTCAQSSVSAFDSIAQYEELQQFIASVSEACSEAGDAAGQQKLHLVAFLEDIGGQTWLDIKAVFIS